MARASPDAVEFPSCRSSLLLGRHQIILLGERGTWLWPTCPGSLYESAATRCRTCDPLMTSPSPSSHTQNRNLYLYPVLNNLTGFSALTLLAGRQDWGRASGQQPQRIFLRRPLRKHNIMKKALRETQTLRAGWSKAEPKIFAPPQTPFPGAQDGQNLISWRWSLPSPTDPVWWRSMHAISSYRGNRPTNTQRRSTHPSQTGPITIHCVAKLSAQCNSRPVLKQKPRDNYVAAQ